MLHKWLDDRRKAKRSLSQDDITHWLRVYAALQATQKLMLQVDEAIEANGGWPGAFSQNHPPPDAATLAAEQMVQKEQLKAQKKAAGSKRKSAASGTGLLDFGDDLDELAEASGAPPRPKARATPAKTAGGKASGGVGMNKKVTKMDTQPGVSQSTESLIAYCRENSRVCPMPQRWSALWELLPNRTRVGVGWQPPLPLILGAWDDTPGMLKMLRLKEHIEWAAKQGALESVARFLRGLREEDWFHFGD